MRDLDKFLAIQEIGRITTDPVEELELTYDYICWLFDNYEVREYSNLFYDNDPPECRDCHRVDWCEKCDIEKEWHNSEEQLSFNNWIDVWGEGIWGNSQQSVDNRVKWIFLDMLYEEDMEYRLWTFDRDNEKWVYYYNRDRFSDYWFIFRRKNK